MFISDIVERWQIVSWKCPRAYVKKMYLWEMSAKLFRIVSCVHAWSPQAINTASTYRCVVTWYHPIASRLDKNTALVDERNSSQTYIFEHIYNNNDGNNEKYLSACIILSSNVPRIVFTFYFLFRPFVYVTYFSFLHHIL